MEDKGLAYYLEKIQQAPSYQDLVFFRNRGSIAVEDINMMRG